MGPVATHAIARAALQAGEKPLLPGVFNHETPAARREED
jgi:multisubunit Na+/H+ antiporter MnhG subunit